jgi:iron complex transport system substrate-binding protein
VTIAAIARKLRNIRMPMHTIRRACLALAVVAAFAANAWAADIVDAAGRKVAVPDRVARVVAAGPPASALMTILAPEKLIGWNQQPSPAELALLPAATRDLPVLGRLTGRGNTANLETIVAAKPDLIVDFGATTDTYVALAERIQAQTGIPYLLIDGRFAHTVESLMLLGAALGSADRAKMLAARVQAIFDRLDGVLHTIPEAKRPRVYLARRDDGLETSYRGALNTEIIERAGGVNVVDTGPLQGGLVNVSLEQVLAWNPDTVITAYPKFAAQAATLAGWRNLDAVQKKRVFLSPRLPFGWIDEPPSLNRAIGLEWLGHVFFPDAFKSDLRADARDFYKAFYQVDLTDADLDRLLAGAPAAP